MEINRNQSGGHGRAVWAGREERDCLNREEEETEHRGKRGEGGTTKGDLTQG